MFGTTDRFILGANVKQGLYFPNTQSPTLQQPVSGFALDGDGNFEFAAQARHRKGGNLPPTSALASRLSTPFGNIIVPFPLHGCGIILLLEQAL